MAAPERIDPQIWQAFLQRHHLGQQEQGDFVAFLTRVGALPIESVQDLEDDYLDFLERGGPPDAA